MNCLNGHQHKRPSAAAPFCYIMSDEVQPSFAAAFVARALQGNFSDVWRPEVMMELLISSPALLGPAGVVLWGTARPGVARRRSYRMVNVSLNTYEPRAKTASKRFYFRTLSELQLADILPPVGARKLRRAATRTSKEAPIITLDHRTSTWIANNTIANQLSSMCAGGFLARDMGLPHETAWYVMCLTAESTNDARTHKIRAMLMKESTLRMFAEDNKECEDVMRESFVDNPTHKARYKLMKRIAKEYVAATDPTKAPLRLNMVERVRGRHHATRIKGDPRFFRIELASAA
eukprot:TRINITY_DN4157_c0_g1_i2.p1 TRINITY_DN4157_c0_g1~~TRINITY_DN4157_c0_g1_i2.p1  ORF type:complete len:291 (+),score=63.59 TRINITY_DN4157_c0_g1_i2:120-992(+)